MNSEQTPASEPDVTAEPDATAEPDVKAQFRAALERKRGQHADAASRRAGQEAKVHEAHGKVGGKRQFRRKSG